MSPLCENRDRSRSRSPISRSRSSPSEESHSEQKTTTTSISHPQITKEMNKLVRNSTNNGGGDDDDIVVHGACNISVTKRDIRSLKTCEWVNDSIIDVYFGLISLRSNSEENDQNYPLVFAFSVHFYSIFLKERYSEIIKRWTNSPRDPVDIFASDLIMFPIYLRNLQHWCLVVADLRNRTMKYYDSLPRTPPNDNGCLNNLMFYLCYEHQERKNSPLDLNSWSWDWHVTEDVPMQNNKYDCGVFTCQYAEYLSRDAPFTFSQTDMEYYRKSMINEIVTQKLRTH